MTSPLAPRIEAAIARAIALGQGAPGTAPGRLAAALDRARSCESSTL